MPTKRVVQRKPVASRNNENTIAHMPDGQSQAIHSRISDRAYILYEKRGREDGHAFEDWLTAEQEVLNQGL